MSCDLPLRKTKCATCPFREGSPYAYLVNDLTASAMSDSRICHSTGKNNAINKRTGKKPHLCRGARDVQLSVMFRMGAIDAETDAAWNRERARIGMKIIEVKDP